MGPKRFTDRRGWAGQWDRHRWSVKKRAPKVEPSELPSEPKRRLRSLDEFERPPKLPCPYPQQGPPGRTKARRYSRDRVLSFTQEEMRLMLLIGIFCGLAYALFIAGGVYQ
jgi:hypothetical protein